MALQQLLSISGPPTWTRCLSSRQFLYVGFGLDGGEALDRVKLAYAPDKDVGKPVRLATKDPDDLTSGSDFNEWVAAKLVIHGGSNKIEVETGEAGTFVFFNLLCNRETRTYYGVLHSAGSVTCTAVDDLGINEKECDEEEDCSEETRLASHSAFTVKVGRATPNSLPPGPVRLPAGSAAT